MNIIKLTPTTLNVNVVSGATGSYVSGPWPLKLNAVVTGTITLEDDEGNPVAYIPGSNRFGFNYGYTDWSITGATTGGSPAPVDMLGSYVDSYGIVHLDDKILHRDIAANGDINISVTANWRAYDPSTGSNISLSKTIALGSLSSIRSGIGSPSVAGPNNNNDVERNPYIVYRPSDSITPADGASAF